MEANTLNPNFCENELKKIKANLRKIFKAVGLENISPGKLLRPRLGLLVAQKLKLVDDITNELTAVELIHNASLFHDDVIDEATVRRNSPSLNFLKGSKFSILYGDLLILNATRLILDSKNREIFELYVKTVENMIMGELIEISNTNNLKLDFQQYMDIIRKKVEVFLDFRRQYLPLFVRKITNFSTISVLKLVLNIKKWMICSIL
jgi:geranylgeranyl pyrophosphate synthase